MLVKHPRKGVTHMTLVGLEFLKHQETQRANRANEDLKHFDVASRVNTADKDRASRESIANLDRLSKEGVASEDRASKEKISDLDREGRLEVARTNNQAQKAIQEYKYQYEADLQNQRLRHDEFENAKDRELKRETNRLNFDIAHMESATKWGTSVFRPLAQIFG